MDVSPIKRSTSRRLSIIYMLFLSGVCFLSATNLLFNEKVLKVSKKLTMKDWTKLTNSHNFQNSSSNSPFLFHKSMSLPNIDNADSGPTLYIITPTYTRWNWNSPLSSDMTINFCVNSDMSKRQSWQGWGRPWCWLRTWSGLWWRTTKWSLTDWNIFCQSLHQSTLC